MSVSNMPLLWQKIFVHIKGPFFSQKGDNESPFFASNQLIMIVLLILDYVKNCILGGDVAHGRPFFFLFVCRWVFFKEK